MRNHVRSLIRGAAALLVVSSLAAAAAAQPAVDCASLDPESFAGLADDQVVVCEGAARTAGELRRWSERREVHAALLAEEEAAAGERLAALARQREEDAAAVRQRMEAVLQQARAGATFALSRDARRLERMRPEVLDLERRMRSARTTAERERLQGQARELLRRPDVPR